MAFLPCCIGFHILDFAHLVVVPWAGSIADAVVISSVLGFIGLDAVLVCVDRPIEVKKESLGFGKDG